MSLFKKVKAKLSQKLDASKEAKQRRQLNESILAKKREEARWQGYEKGNIERARMEGYRKGKGQQGIPGKTRNTLGKFAAGSQAGLDFLNQDLFGTGFGTTPKPHHTTEHEGKNGKGVSIHVDGTTIHVGKKEQKKTLQHKRTVPKKKKSKTTSMFDLF